MISFCFLARAEVNTFYQRRAMVRTYGAAGGAGEGDGGFRHHVITNGDVSAASVWRGTARVPVRRVHVSWPLKWPLKT